MINNENWEWYIDKGFNIFSVYAIDKHSKKFITGSDKKEFHGRTAKLRYILIMIDRGSEITAFDQEENTSFSIPNSDGIADVNVLKHETIKEIFKWSLE